MKKTKALSQDVLLKERALFYSVKNSLSGESTTPPPLTNCEHVSIKTAKHMLRIDIPFSVAPQTYMACLHRVLKRHPQYARTIDNYHMNTASLF